MPLARERTTLCRPVAVMRSWSWDGDGAGRLGMVVYDGGLPKVETTAARMVDISDGC